VPVAASLFLSKSLRAKLTITDKAMTKLRALYKPLLEKALSVPKTIVLVSLQLFVGSVFILTRLGGEFIPELEEGDFAIDTRVLPGSSLNTTIASTQKASAVLLDRFPEVQKVVTKIGSGEIPTDPMPPEASDLMVILKDKKEWTSAKSFDELAEKMNTALKEVPGITLGFQFPVQMRFNELMTGARQDVVCIIYGDDLDSLAAAAARLGEIIPTVEGAKDLYVEKITGMPQMIVEINRPALVHYGVSVNEINRVLKTAFAGEVAGYVYEGEKRFDLTVRMSEELRLKPDLVQNLPVRTSRGYDVALSELAHVRIMEGPFQIQRQNTKRKITVGFNVRGRDVQSVVEELKTKVKQADFLPQGYTIHYGGQFENLNAAKNRLAIAVPLALLLILLLLYFAFRSLKYGLLIFSAIPLSAIGGILALVLRDMPFSISAGVGFIALFGVAVLNGIVLVAEFNRLKKEGLTDIKQIVIHGAEVRLRPVLMTAAVASLGFLPMALSNGAGAEVQRPLATVVIGGLITSTLLTLLVLPVLFVLVENFSFSLSRKKKILLLILLPMTAILHAQNTALSLKAALDSAEKNNYQLRADDAFINSKKAEIKTAWDVPQTITTVQYGQYNSAFNDYNIGISQQIQFPTVYVARKNALQGLWTSALLDREIHSQEIKKQIRTVFYDYQVFHKKEILLSYADSIYGEAFKRAQFRLQAGESNLLEKLAIENQALQIKQQLKAVQLEKQALIIEFSRLINASERVEPEISEPKYSPSEESGTAVFSVIKSKEQAVTNARNLWKLEKARFAPDLLLGYNNTGLTGFQNITGTEEYYSPDRRFSYITAGVSIPIFGGAQAARVKTAKLDITRQENQLAETRLKWKSELERSQKELNGYKMILSDFENVNLPNAEKISELAMNQLRAGEISYLEWMVLVNQSIQIRNEYLNQLRLYNQSVINNLYLNNQ
jgi:cobalt-zinc-cadmium resistance protein CzcA